MGNLWQKGERCRDQKVFSGVRNVFKTKYFLSKSAEDDLLRVWTDAHVGVGLKRSSLLLSRTERSFGISPSRRPYGNMFLNNFLISIFRYCPYVNQDVSCPEIGKRI
jgi:hypothetical protein